MSAFIVPKTHIDALVNAGLHLAGPGHGDQLRWFWPSLAIEPVPGTHQAGEPWGPDALRVMQERRRELTEETAGRVGQMLWIENRRSVNHRYAEDELEQPYVFAEMGTSMMTLGLVVQAIRCYEYQSCEHPEWEASEAFAFCDALRREVFSKIPGQDMDAWPVNDPDLFGRDRSLLGMMKKKRRGQ